MLWLGIPATRAYCWATWPFPLRWVPSGLKCLRLWERFSLWREHYAKIERSGTALPAIANIKPGSAGVCCREFGSWICSVTKRALDGWRFYSNFPFFHPNRILLSNRIHTQPTGQ